jgi:SAM-dependent methyltransferase
LLIWRTDFAFYTAERSRLAAEWNQVRFTSLPLPEGPNLINHRLDEPLPFPDESFDDIYSFHVIEHLTRPDNERFTRDIHRLLKPGGIYRASTPDLEFLATEYLRRLHEQIASASVDNYRRYNWALCNLIDQCTRQESGGEMLQAIRGGEYDPEHVRQMNGDILRYLFPSGSVAPHKPAPGDAGAAKKTRRFFRRILGKIRHWPRSARPQKSYFELSYEKNLWLWDRVSLGRVFAAAGLRNIAAFDYRTSGVPDWDRYDFDQSAFGDYALEPSLHLEGSKEGPWTVDRKL